jgi:hypothetical protein
MKEYKRLTKRDEEFGIIALCNSCSRKAICPQEEECVACIDEEQERLAELEDKIEQGILIELPCKVGDTVYVIRKKALKGHWEEHRYIVDEWGKLAVYEKEFNLVLFSVSKIGEDYFLTKAEAEAKLKELKEKDNDR